MEDNFYINFWLQRLSKPRFLLLIAKLTKNIKFPEKVDQEEYLMQYLHIFYFTVALQFCGLTMSKIFFIIDLTTNPSTSQTFRPDKMLEEQKDVVPDLVKYITDDVKSYEVLCSELLKEG